nr:response regulator [candidate division Zixibacteria bacterium]
MAKILVIDDSSFQRKWIARAVTSLGHKAAEAENGQQGLTLIDSVKPDCITVDLNMPEMDGIEFLGNLKNLNQDIPVIVITSDIQGETKKQCAQLGAAAFLNKPFKTDDLKNALTNCLKSTPKL